MLRQVKESAFVPTNWNSIKNEIKTLKDQIINTDRYFNINDVSNYLKTN